MAYRITFQIDNSLVEKLRAAGNTIDQVVAPIMRDGLSAIQHYAVQNLSGVPFESKSGAWTIQKRTGKGAASIQVQYPYGSPFVGRLFADARTQYPGNSESYNYLKILEKGHGGIEPKYTSSMQGGKPGRASLVIPGGPVQLVNGQGGFRGVTGRYRFVKKIKPLTGRYWLDAAAKSAEAELPEIISTHLNAQFSSVKP
jgi:hypothetical protein